MDITEDQLVQAVLYLVGYGIGWFWPRQKSHGRAPAAAPGPPLEEIPNRRAIARLTPPYAIVSRPMAITRPNGRTP